MTKKTLVALDIETTGLSADNDRIIEIAAVRFSQTGIEDEFQTLVNPGKQIPPFITQLTGISDAMVRGAKIPQIDSAIKDLSEFVKDSPVVGHNVKFDLSFLRAEGALKKNPSIDTYEMAAVVLPFEGRYNLRALGQVLGVPLRATHRALDDTKVTQAIYKIMYELILDLSLPTLREIVRLSKSTAWDGTLPFQWALEERQTNSSAEAEPYQNPLLTQPVPLEIDPLQPNDSIKGLDLDEVSAVLEPGGPFHKSFPDYEHRSEQLEMLRATARAISEGRHYLIEAGTGIGKSLAYLIPSALWAIKNQKRVVISTNTINLQDQLISKDIPLLLDTLDLKCRATVLKGRSNYLCPHHLDTLRNSNLKTEDEMRVLGKILVWMDTSLSGDRGEINLNGPQERRIWNRVSADHEDCSTEGCLKRTGGRCPFYQARQRAHSSHIIIVNHALLLADVATGNRVLPEYDTLVIDEAHHLENATTSALSFYTSQTLLRRSLSVLGDEKKGILNWVITLGEGSLSPSDFGALNKLVQSISTRSFKTQSRMDEVFRILQKILERSQGNRSASKYTQHVRIESSTKSPENWNGILRSQPAWDEIEASWDLARQSFYGLLEDIQKLWEAINELIGNKQAEGSRYEAILDDLREASRELYEMYENIDNLVFEPDPNMIYWVESNPQNPAVAIQAAPLHIGELMERFIWFEKRAVILTSATLTTAGSFDYIRNRLKAEDAEELSLGSPFDYQNAALLYLVEDIPEPSDFRGHQLALNKGLINLCKSTGGRTMVLFTSYSQLNETAKAITGPLAQEGIIVYEQGSGPSPHTLLKSFRQAEQAVLLGTRAFWEGVDIPGQDLSVLVIAKLPFQVPSDPIVAARAETYQESFQEYMLPEAILSFRQGFGRLIRTKQDLGVVVIFDKRLLTKSYGSLFLNSLPNCTIQQGFLSDLPETASRWLNI